VLNSNGQARPNRELADPPTTGDAYGLFFDGKEVTSKSAAHPHVQASGSRESVVPSEAAVVAPSAAAPVTVTASDLST
jgi:hypothetical protein